MRCLIVIALCFALANATYFSKNRFQNLLNRHQDLLGSDDLDDYIEDYVDQIRREKIWEREQCPHDFDDMGDEEEYETEGMDDRHRDFDEEIQPPSHLIKEVEDANFKLASRLYQQSKDERDDKNTVVSPISIQLALAALNHGARGNTKRQIGRAIGGRLQQNERKEIFSELVRHLKGLRRTDFSTYQRTKINTVTGIFVSEMTRAQQQFVHQVKSNLGASVKHCTFHRQPQECRQLINQFVSQKTHHKINHIVPQDAITDNTKMILVNALELKATWGPQMRHHVTKEAKFYSLETNKVKIVEVMETQGRFKYYEDELVKIVGIPTQDKEVTMYIIVPKDKDGLTEVEKLHLQDSVELKRLLDQTDRQVRNVEVHLPKFQIKHKIDVRRTLRKQGVTDAFDPRRADFSGITGGSQYDQNSRRSRRNPLLDTEDQYSRRNPFLDQDIDYEMDDEYAGQEQKLHLNKFIHQATIKITENGITATSGSQAEEYEGHHNRLSRHHYGNQGVDSDEWEPFSDIISSLRRDRETTGHKVVRANHAFAFAIKHNPTKQLILVGRVIDAAQKKIQTDRYY